ncbi:SCO family protein [Roseivirga sp. BDSF3-8]|uniref:SCO family protein n=1 Tax=Roseivirga sp. BDSF3-8 TaxID=3241598 RepID=UPI003531D6DD
MRTTFLLLLTATTATMTGCGKGKMDQGDAALPIYSPMSVEQREVEGQVVRDTVYDTIDDFAFVNQDSMVVTNATVDGKIYVADFFFTSCTTICPKMKQQMVRVYDRYKGNEEVALLSFSIDPEYDTVNLLNNYAEALGVSSDTWHFLTGEKEKIYEIGQGSFRVTAKEDPTARDGFLHSGAFTLVDKEGRVRGYYDGTVPEEVDKLIDDMALLLKEYRPARKDSNS